MTHLYALAETFEPHNTLYLSFRETSNGKLRTISNIYLPSLANLTTFEF